MLQVQEHVREQKVAELVEFLKGKEGQVVKISQLVFGTLLNILGNVIFSKDVFRYVGADGDKMQTLIKEMLMIGAAPNLAEFWPIFEEFDLQGLKKRCNQRFSEVMKMWKGTVEERKVKRNEEPKDMLDVLLLNDFNDAQINAVFLETFGPGSETSSATSEWALAELIKNPHILAKVRQELDQVVGKSTVKESDLPHLPYLQACIKETMRLHPAAPFLLPHRAVETCPVMGYTIPKDTQVLVNIYAIGRDPKTWKEPTTFKPERFLESDVDYYGKHFEFIPFGAGRRQCVGMPLATRTIPLIVSNLVQTLDWSLPDGKLPQDLVMNESLSLSLALDPTLTVIPKSRV
nr:CYP80G3 [Sinopodophyllum hexandrum]